jgi:Rod binding domain-containing protein
MGKLSEKISNNSYSMLNKLKQKPANKQYIPNDFKNVASGIEKQFAEEMLRQMNKTTGQKAGGSDSKFYKSMLNSERANALAQNNGGLGIQDLILDEIYPRRMRNPLAFQNYEQGKKMKRDIVQMQPTEQVQKIGMQREQSQGLPADLKTNAKEASDE